MHGNTKDLTNQKFERLTIIRRDFNKKRIYWICDCECGTKNLSIRGDLLRLGNTKSCGCLQKEKAKEAGKLNRKYEEGIIKSSEYYAWSGMIQRCTNSNSESFHNYGKRGITVFNMWTGKAGFKEFYNYIGSKPDETYSLDRVNVNGNYEPGNVRWASPDVQNQNKRITVIQSLEEANIIRKEFSTGEFTLSEIAEKYNCAISTIGRVIQNKTWTI
jgi:hypothetical protein